MSDCLVSVRVEKAHFDMACELEKLRMIQKGVNGGRDGDIGAVISFLGLCRDENGALAALEIEHFPKMAQMAVERIAGIAAARFPLRALSIIHRYGLIAAGEEIVLVMAASEHRVAAFDAVQLVMDYLKTEAPFWKKQHWHDSQKEGDHKSAWVGAYTHDLQRRQRW